MNMKFLLGKKFIWFLILLGAAGIWWWRGQSQKSKTREERTAIVERGNVAYVLELSGRVEAERRAVLNFPSSGRLGYVKVRMGDQVARGQYLMGLDMGDLQASERAAFYNYLAADANAKQVEDEVKGHDSDETFVQKNKRVAAQTARDRAYDTWISAQRAARNANLVAPFGGIVADITTISVGDTVGVADGVTIVDPESLYFETEVDEADIEKVRAGMGADLVLDAFGEEKFRGEIESIGFVAGVSDTGATVYKARIIIQGVGDKQLRVGMNGDAYVLREERKGVLKLPIEAVDDGEVDLVGGNKIKVETGLESETEVEIKSGLKEGDRVVIR